LMSNYDSLMVFLNFVILSNYSKIDFMEKIVNDGYS